MRKELLSALKVLIADLCIEILFLNSVRFVMWKTIIAPYQPTPGMSPRAGPALIASSLRQNADARKWDPAVDSMPMMTIKAPTGGPV